MTKPSFFNPIVKNSCFLIYSEEFYDVLGDNPQLTKLIKVNAHEGPVYIRKRNAVYFTTVRIPFYNSFYVSLKKLSLDNNEVSLVRERTNMANGMTLDHDCRLLICEQGTKMEKGRISRLDLDTNVIETVVDNWFGLPFNSPGDVVVKSDGTIWFTDPSYGYKQGFKNEPLLGNFVYRHDPVSGSTTVVADSFIRPNGLAFSPDESVLYIGDSSADLGNGTHDVMLRHHLRAFDVKDGRHLINDRLFAVITPGVPDGVKVDSKGNVYTTSTRGIKVYNPLGDLIGEILVTGVANFTFGGPENNVLYMMADKAIYAASLAATGAIDRCLD